MNGKKSNVKMLTVSLTLIGLITFSVLFKNIFETTENLSNVHNETSTGMNTTELVVPTRDSVLKDGYPVNENGQTYGPNMENLMLVEPDLLLVEGENGVVGYIHQTKSISSPSELAAISSRESTPVYLQDGKTIIGTFNFKKDYGYSLN